MKNKVLCFCVVSIGLCLQSLPLHIYFRCLSPTRGREQQQLNLDIFHRMWWRSKRTDDRNDAWPIPNIQHLQTPPVKVPATLSNTVFNVFMGNLLDPCSPLVEAQGQRQQEASHSSDSPFGLSEVSRIAVWSTDTFFTFQHEGNRLWGNFPQSDNRHVWEEDYHYENWRFKRFLKSP